MHNHLQRPKYFTSRTMRFWMAIAFVCLSTVASHAQNEVPILKANSPNISIIDGTNASRGDWHLDPSIELDVYNAIRSEKKKTITFKSDIDSRSFEVEPGNVYDFVIMLNGSDACKTRISTMVQGLRRINKNNIAGPVTIPITIEHGKLHLVGTVNGSKTLDLIFDTGADTCVIYPSAKSKGVELTLDDTVLNQGSGGVTERPLSLDNRLEISDAYWTHEPFIYVEKQADGADGIVGFTVFENRVVEIDYDRMIMLIHDSLPSYSDGFSKTEMPFSGSLPAVEVVMTNGENSYRGPFILDTAGNGCMLVNQAFANDHHMHSTLKKVGIGVARGVGSRAIQSNQLMLPKLSVAGHSLHDVPLHVELPSDWNQAPPGGVVCMEVLSRFNTILDFPAGEAYFKPNSRFAQPFRIRSPGPSIQFVVTVVVIAMFITATLWFLARKRKHPSLNHVQ